MNQKNVMMLLGLSLWCFSVLGNQYSYEDLDNLKNDKEVSQNVYSTKELDEILTKYPDPGLRNKIGNILYRATLDFLNNSNLRCELNLIENFKSILESENLNTSKESIDEYIIMARSIHVIDDIYYELLSGINSDYHQLNRLSLMNDNETQQLARRWKSKVNNQSRNSKSSLYALLQKNDINKLYSNFESWPDEKDFCVYQEMNFIKTDLIDPDSKDRKISTKKKSKILKTLNHAALGLEKISSQTFLRLEYLRKDSFTARRDLRLEDYLNIIFKAKNKLKPNSFEYVIKDIETEYNFSTERLKRFSDLTRRKKLYQKYNETQILMLAQVLVRASRRMGVDPDVTASRPVISQSFEFINQNGEKENYVEELVLDTQSQFNLARRRMRKDILDLEAMDIFYDTNIYYEEVVMAAFETGYLSIEDIEYAVLYDDLWNPTKSKFEKVTGFIFKITGVATFFIPPPLNIPATLGLAIIDGFVQKKNIKGEDNDNAATFIQ